ncbi:hypothetical protein ACQCSV_02150 [Pseudarthrobacter sp. S3]|uniref:hypothetical protein n=1 Tax=Pseudarthrobacter sp. S3 TaxID=3418419 RepID=UPI003CF07F8B
MPGPYGIAALADAPPSQPERTVQDTARFLPGLSVLRAGLADADPATAFEALLAEEDIPVGELAHRLGISPLLASPATTTSPT